MFARSGEIPSPGQTSIAKTNDCAMKSERGAPVRGSDPPSGQRCSQNDRWYVAGAGQASDTHTFGRCYVENRRLKLSIPLRWQKIGLFSGFRALDTAGNLSPPRPRIHLISSGPSSTFTGLARHEPGWPWVAPMSRSKAYRRVSCFWSACWLFSTWKPKFRGVRQSEQIILDKQTFFFSCSPLW